MSEPELLCPTQSAQYVVNRHRRYTLVHRPLKRRIVICWIIAHVLLKISILFQQKD